MHYVCRAERDMRGRATIGENADTTDACWLVAAKDMALPGSTARAAAALRWDTRAQMQRVLGGVYGAARSGWWGCGTRMTQMRQRGCRVWP